MPSHRFVFAQACRPALGVVFMASLGMAHATDLPKRKPGQWESKVTLEGRAPMTMNQCIDASTDDLSKAMAGDQKGCDKAEITRSGDALLVTTRCEIDGHRMLSKGRIVMKGDAAYSGSSTTPWDPPMAGKASMKTTVEARWTGPCAAGMKPGDVKIDGLPSMNLQDLPKLPANGQMSREDMEKMREQAMKMLEEMKKSGKIPAN